MNPLYEYARMCKHHYTVEVVGRCPFRQEGVTCGGCKVWMLDNPTRSYELVTGWAGMNPEPRPKVEENVDNALRDAVMDGNPVLSTPKGAHAVAWHMDYIALHAFHDNVISEKEYETIKEGLDMFICTYGKSIR